MAAIGLTDQYLNEKIDRYDTSIFCLVINKHSKIILLCSDKYVSDAENLHEHVMRHNHGTDENGVSINCMKIAFDAEYPLFYIDFCNIIFYSRYKIILQNINLFAFLN